MMTQKIDKPHWRPFLEWISKGLDGKRAEIEIASLDLGDQVQAEWVPLIGLTYDPKSDAVEVALDGLDHMIRRPRELYYAELNGGLSSLEVVDAEGVRQIVKLKDPLMLPAPQQH